MTLLLTTFDWSDPVEPRSLRLLNVMVAQGTAFASHTALIVQAVPYGNISYDCINLHLVKSV